MKARRSLRQSQTPRVKQKQKLTLVYAAAGIALAAIIGVGVFIYINLGSNTDTHAKSTDGYLSSGLSNWADVSTWTKSQSWMADSPGTNVNTGFVDIEGFVTSDLDLKLGGSTVLTVYDTLWINGNITVGAGSSLVVEPNGLLVILGDYVTDGGALTNNGGRIVVMRDLKASGGPDIINNNDFYVYRNIESKGGSTFNGDKNNPSNSNFGNEQDLMNDDPGLYNFVNGESVMPITLSYFKVSAVDDRVDVLWATEMEDNNDYFTIERSADGQVFEEAGEVRGAGTSHRTLKYNFTDESPLSGTSYYRLKQTDFNGDYTFSDIQVITIREIGNSVASITLNSVAPNPFSERFSVDFTLPGDGEAEIRLLNYQGGVEFSEVVEGYKGRNQYEFLDRQGLKSGIYMLVIQQRSLKTKVFRVIKR